MILKFSKIRILFDMSKNIKFNITNITSDFI